jgi:hypothetical protein
MDLPHTLQFMFAVTDCLCFVGQQVSGGRFILRRSNQIKMEEMSDFLS